MIGVVDGIMKSTKGLEGGREGTHVDKQICFGQSTENYFVMISE